MAGAHARSGRKRDYLNLIQGGKRGGKPVRKMAPPEHLSDPGKRIWMVWEPILRRMGLFHPDFAVALERACELYADVVELRGEIRKHGRFYQAASRTGEVLWKPHPAQGQLADSDRRLCQYLSELGLTPAGRAKLLSSKVIPEKDDNSDEAEFFG